MIKMEPLILKQGGLCFRGRVMTTIKLSVCYWYNYRDVVESSFPQLFDFITTPYKPVVFICPVNTEMVASGAQSHGAQCRKTPHPDAQIHRLLGVISPPDFYFN